MNQSRRIHYLSLRLSTADEPPAEEANEAPDDNDDGDRDARDGTGCEESFLLTFVARCRIPFFTFANIVVIDGIVRTSS